MKLSLKATAILSTLSALMLGSAFVGTSAAHADTKGFDNSYVGAGVSAGVTNGGQTGDAANFGGNIQGRFAVPNAPVSVRGAVLFNGESSAIVPTVTYDLPVAKNTNVYAGAGYSFVQSQGQPTPVGNQNAPVLTVGVESQVTKGVVVYSDAKLGVGAYQSSPASSLGLQAGVGVTF